MSRSINRNTYHRAMVTRMPELPQLQLLVAISEHGSLRAAAEAIGMAQPNATRILGRLERQLGLTLVSRSPTGSELTTSGSLVVHWAREVLEAGEKLMVAAAALHSDSEANLTVGASMTVAEYLVPRWLGEFRTSHRDVAVDLLVNNTHEIFDRVRSGDCHVGFVETPRIPRGLRSIAVAADRLVVVVAPAHPWARRRRPVTPAELAATPLIVREQGSGTRLALEQLLHGHELATPALELSSNAAVRISVGSGMAPAVLSNLAVEAAAGSGQLRIVELEGVETKRLLRAIWRGSARPSGPAGDLIAIARGEVR
jgi:DNA-binding transcriptional LysR family regulator